MAAVSYPEVDAKIKSEGQAVMNNLNSVMKKDASVPDLSNSAEIKKIQNNIK